MMRYILLVCLVWFLVSCNNSKKTELTNENWLKGNLHTHSLWSDGDDFPEMIASAYKKRGYNFLSFSEHNKFQVGEQWIPITRSPQRRKALAEYLDVFGEDWVEIQKDSISNKVRLKGISEYRNLLEDSSFQLIQSQEITMGVDGKPVHVNATGTNRQIAAPKASTVFEAMQSAIDSVIQQRKETGKSMFPHINHPNFGYAVSADDMKRLRGERFFEVYNGHPLVHNEGDSTHLSTEEMWDEINTHYYQENKPLLLGLAVDDSHHYHLSGAKFSNSFRGWVMVNSPVNRPSAIIEALEKGDFYASSGVSLHQFHESSDSIGFSILSEAGVSYRTYFIGLTEGSNKVEILYETDHHSPTYNLKGDEIFVRARVISNELKINPYQIGETEKAWTQPILISNIQK